VHVAITQFLNTVCLDVFYGLTVCYLVMQAVRIVGGLLRRLSTEVWWRGFVVAGLAGWLYSTWESAGEGQGC
jgi:hypothetical protein